MDSFLTICNNYFIAGLAWQTVVNSLRGLPSLVSLYSTAPWGPVATAVTIRHIINAYQWICS